MNFFLSQSDVIDWGHPLVMERAVELARGSTDAIDIAKRCFEWVRDEIRHSRDHLRDAVPCSASETLLAVSGYCYAKSHLLAALLRACGMPAGLCYQRLTRDGVGGPFCLHGLNGLELPNIGWRRIDPRGNRHDIDAQFDPSNERLAFAPQLAGEYDLPGIWPEPLPAIVEALRGHGSAEFLWDRLPDHPSVTVSSTTMRDAAESILLQTLNAALRRDSVATKLKPVVERLLTSLAANASAPMVWENVPLQIYGSDLPRQIRSSWVFILRAGATTGAERHPNSHQRMVSLQGVGDLQTGRPGRWQSNLLVSDLCSSLEKGWVSVPPNVWHQAVVPNKDWVVVSFHTAPANELVEERPDNTNASRMVRRTYLPGGDEQQP
jgi:hypothetical protein